MEETQDINLKNVGMTDLIFADADADHSNQALTRYISTAKENSGLPFKYNSEPEMGDVSQTEEEAERKKHQCSEQQQAAADLIFKEQLVELGHSEIDHLRESLSLATAQQELSIKEIPLRDEMNTESQNYAPEIKLFHSEERKLKGLFEEELRSCREDIKMMKETISAAASGLQERDDMIKTLNEKLKTTEAEQSKTADLLKEKIYSMNKMKINLEMLQMDLEDYQTILTLSESHTEELKRTVESLEAQLAHSNGQMSEVEARLETSKAQVLILETHLEEMQTRNTSLEAERGAKEL